MAREGSVHLEVAPRSVRLDVAGHIHMTVSEEFVTLRRLDRKRAKARSMRFGDRRLLVARSTPTQDVGVWFESQADRFVRLLGIRPVELLEAEAFGAWNDLDRLAGQLKLALSPRAGAVVRATEFGSGADRVLVLDDGECLAVYVRRLFRGWHGRVLEVCAGGKVTIPHKYAAHVIEIGSRYQVTIIGDRIRFALPSGKDLGFVAIPWISPEDRELLARSIADRVESTPYRALTPPRAALP